MDIVQFYSQFSSNEYTIAYMRNSSLIRQIPPICGRNGCPRRMTQVKNATFVFDGYQWRCPTHKGQKVSIRARSFWEEAHFPLHKGLLLAYCWALSINYSRNKCLKSIRHPTPYTKTNAQHINETYNKLGQFSQRDLQ